MTHHGGRWCKTQLTPFPQVLESCFAYWQKQQTASAWKWVGDLGAGSRSCFQPRKLKQGESCCSECAAVDLYGFIYLFIYLSLFMKWDLGKSWSKLSSQEGSSFDFIRWQFQTSFRVGGGEGMCSDQCKPNSKQALLAHTLPVSAQVTQESHKLSHYSSDINSTCSSKLLKLIRIVVWYRDASVFTHPVPIMDS